MDNEDAVTTPAEQTVETESAPVENQDANIQSEETETPVESNQPEEEISGSVQKRFHSYSNKVKSLTEENEWLR